MMDAFRAEAIRLSLRRMFEPNRYFDICALRDCLTAAKIVPPKETMDELHPLHCVHWSEMTPEMRAEVQRRVLALFSLPEVDFGDMATPLIGGADVGKPSGLFRRLLGKGADA
jgi:hypothetical protein